MKAIVLCCFLCLFGINPAAAQPTPPRGPGVTTPASRILIERLAKAKAALKDDAARRIDRSIVDRGHPVARTAAAKLMDTRLGSAVAGFQQKLEQMRLQQIATHKRDPQFLGVIDSIRIGDLEISLERRKVRTERGLQSLLLTRFGSKYIYDGDIVVPWNAIETGNSVVFSAGMAGTFGKGTLWDNAIIPFEVEPAFCCKDALAEAIAYYHANTIFQFVARDGHETYVRFVNAEPFIDSHTDHLGKKQGENTVRIQGTGSDGQSVGHVAAVANIQHEIGHTLGLIHEHLRSDRDKFIARNPTCMSGNLVQGIRDGWVDVTQSTFVDDKAELLTAYDFDSIMHYQFLLDVDGDGFGDCSTWVRIATCPNRDPTSSACNGNFSSFQLSPLDIDGLHKLYASIPNDREIATFSADNVRHRGRKVDRCLQGLPLGQDGCSAEARGAAADAFCRAKGFQHGVGVTTENAWGEHSGYDVIVGWKNVWGTDVISSITCEGRSSDPERVTSGELEAQTFTRSEIRVGGRPIDRCVHGARIIGDRCSEENQERIANRFCELKGFQRSSSGFTDFSVEANATGFRPANNDFHDVSASDIFTEVTCVRQPAGAATSSKEFSGSAVKHRGKRIDRCLQGTSFGEDGCSQAALQRVANEFCRVKGFRDAKQIQIQGDVGEHSLFDKVVGWKNSWGTDAISFVRCEHQTNEAADIEANAIESKSFTGSQIKVSDRRVDRCMHGDEIVGDRCSAVNQRRIANKFCKLKEFDHSSEFATDSRFEADATGYHPKTDDFRNVSSLDVFTEITCVRPPA